MKLNDTTSRDISSFSFMSVFHSVLFEQMADIEAMGAISENDTVSEIKKENLFEKYQSLLPSYLSLADVNPYSMNDSFHSNRTIPTYPDYNYDSNLSKNTIINDLFEDVTDTATSGIADPCHLITGEEAASYQTIAFHLELIVQPIFVFIGFGFNTIAINILSSNSHPHLNNVFNGLLIWLAIFDNCFMMASIIENFWRHFGIWWHYIFNMGYCFLLYPFKNFAMTCITNIQVALSIERLKAIKHPIDYHRHNSNKKTRNAMTKAYISKVAIAAFLFCMPKFFESKIVPKTEEREILDPISNSSKTVEVSEYDVDFSNLRFNKYYVLVYQIAIRQLATAIIPFVIIVSMNVQTFMIIRRRQRLSPRLQNRRSQLLNDQAARQSYVLLAILVVYGICHIPSFVLAINEVITLDLIRSSLKSGCHVVKFWTLVTGTVSQALLTVNSSINFLLYPAISKDFQSVFKQYMSHKMGCILGLLQNWKCRSTATTTFSNGSTRSIPESCPATIRGCLQTTPMLEDVEDTSIHLAEMPNLASTSSGGDTSPENHTYSSNMDESIKNGDSLKKVRLLHSMSLDDKIHGIDEESQLFGICPHLENENHIDQAIARCWISPIRRLSLIQFAKGDFI